METRGCFLMDSVEMWKNWDLQASLITGTYFSLVPLGMKEDFAEFLPTLWAPGR